MTPPNLLARVMHFLRDSFPTLPQQIPAPEDFVVSGIRYLIDGRHNFPPGGAAHIDLRLQFLSCLCDLFDRPGQCLTITFPAGHAGKQRSHAVGIRLYLLQFFFQHSHLAPGVQVAVEILDLFIIGHFSRFLPGHGPEDLRRSSRGGRSSNPKEYSIFHLCFFRYLCVLFSQRSQNVP